jgi:TRAP-type C4-dicarboxylate transport system substrate-binding protein
VATLHEVNATARKESLAQETEEIEKAKKEGVQFFKLSDADMAFLKEKGDAVHQKYAAEINKLYPGDQYKPENYLKEVQVFMGYTK